MYLFVGINNFIKYRINEILITYFIISPNSFFISGMAIEEVQKVCFFL